MKARVVTLVALAAAMTLAAVAAAGPAPARQRVAIDMKIYPQGTFVLTPLQAGSVKTDSGTIDSNWTSIPGRKVMRDGQEVTIYNGAVTTLTGKRGPSPSETGTSGSVSRATGMATVRTTASASGPGRSRAGPASTPGSSGRGGMPT
jgi:hypothetical protein